MIYLDYSRTTKVSMDAMNAYLSVSKEYIGSVSSNNYLGKKSKDLLNKSTKELSEVFNINSDEIIYTSSGTEANNMAILGTCLGNHKKGRHIIVSKLEHPSIYEICKYLESIGFKISYVGNDQDGLIDFEELKSLIKEDTILVSISGVNYETGIRQPLKVLKQIIKKENENTIFHSDLCEALGKTQVNFNDVDLATISSHKINGPKGVGILYKARDIKIFPLIFGDNKNKSFKPGEVPLPLIISMNEAIKRSVKDLDKKERYINLLNQRILNGFSNYANILINNTKYSIPHIISISLIDAVSEEVLNSLSDREVYISGNLHNEVSASVYALTKDLQRSKNVLRISLSSDTTVVEVNSFLTIFAEIYNNLKF